MTATVQSLGVLAATPRGKAFVLSGQYDHNQHGRISSYRFFTRHVLSSDTQNALDGLIPGQALLVKSRLIGLTNDPGQTLLLVTEVTPLSTLPTETDAARKMVYTPCGFEHALLAGNAHGTPLVEDFGKNGMRVTIPVTFNGRNDTINAVFEGDQARNYAGVQIGDRITATGIIREESITLPNGKPQSSHIFEASRNDTTDAATWQRLTQRPRRGNKRPDQQHSASAQASSAQASGTQSGKPSGKQSAPQTSNTNSDRTPKKAAAPNTPPQQGAAQQGGKNKKKVPGSKAPASNAQETPGETAGEVQPQESRSEAVSSQPVGQQTPVPAPATPTAAEQSSAEQSGSDQPNTATEAVTQPAAPTSAPQTPDTPTTQPQGQQTLPASSTESIDSALSILDTAGSAG